ncbi:MAG: hypothetical protein JWR02_1147 [Mucilaginibacter sp.]|nr:hypothetical protein [Mucilaginibacter sp.]
MKKVVFMLEIFKFYRFITFSSKTIHIIKDSSTFDFKPF